MKFQYAVIVFISDFNPIGVWLYWQVPQEKCGVGVKVPQEKCGVGAKVPQEKCGVGAKVRLEKCGEC